MHKSSSQIYVLVYVYVLLFVSLCRFGAEEILVLYCLLLLLSLVSAVGILSLEIGWKRRLRNDLG